MLDTAKVVHDYHQSLRMSLRCHNRLWTGVHEGLLALPFPAPFPMPCVDEVNAEAASISAQPDATISYLLLLLALVAATAGWLLIMAQDKEHSRSRKEPAAGEEAPKQEAAAPSRRSEVVPPAVLSRRRSASPITITDADSFRDIDDEPSWLCEAQTVLSKDCLPARALAPATPAAVQAPSIQLADAKPMLEPDTQALPGGAPSWTRSASALHERATLRREVAEAQGLLERARVERDVLVGAVHDEECVAHQFAKQLTTALEQATRDATLTAAHATVAAHHALAAKEASAPGTAAVEEAKAPDTAAISPPSQGSRRVARARSSVAAISACVQRGYHHEARAEWDAATNAYDAAVEGWRSSAQAARASPMRMAATDDPDLHGQLRAAFDAADTDRSGALSKRELYRSLARIGLSPSSSECLRVWNAFDCNADGMVEWPEYRRCGAILLKHHRGLEVKRSGAPAKRCRTGAAIRELEESRRLRSSIPSPALARAHALRV